MRWARGVYAPRWRAWVRAHQELLLSVASAVLLAVGGGLWLLGERALAESCWIAATVLGLVFSVAGTLRALRERRPTVDLIAMLALAGTLIVDEPFAGAVITVMLATGELLEARAEARAQRELSLLVQRAPTTARRRVDAGVREVAVSDVCRGDSILVGTGEVVPVDGRLSSVAILDEAALTGESQPVERAAGDNVRSGVVNSGPPVELVATTTADESTYAGVVRLVEQAHARSAPFVRIADRLAVLFVPLAIALAGVAWAVGEDPVRAVAVLVASTPCPLLLAAPIAIMSGLSCAARVGAVIKGGGVLERLADGRVMLFDKTGTLTCGQPTLAALTTAGDHVDADETLRLAASLEQVSPHVLATAIVTPAVRRGLTLQMPSDVQEVHGYGLSGRVGSHSVRVGKAGWTFGESAPAWVRQVRRRADLDGSLSVFVAIDGELAGAFLLDDPIRPDAPRMVRALRETGIRRVMLITGDRADVAETVGRVVGVDAVLAECDPEDKLAAIVREAEHGVTVMVGDGINDAPALAAADVGVALAARGATASSEAADVVLTVDRLDALADATLIARRSKRIAVQAVSVSMGLALLAMGAATIGLLPPAAGALLHEGIDVLAIAIALRALVPGRLHSIALPPEDVATAQQLQTEHEAVLVVVEQIRAVADALSTETCDLAPVRALVHRLETELIPHERADEALLVPLLARALGGVEATAALSRTHAEIEYQTGRLSRLLGDLGEDKVQPEDVVELRRLLYGLYGVLRLHNAQEAEGALSVVPPPNPALSGHRPDDRAG